MAYNSRSSFIPNETQGAIPMQVRKKRTIHIFSLLATIILIASLVAAAGSALYKGFLDDSLVNVKNEFTTISRVDDERKMEEIRIYDRKLTVAHNLLDNHIAPSRMFEALEQTTKTTVQFDSVSYTYDPGFEALITVTGRTEEFASVALQKMQLIRDALFTEYVVQEITAPIPPRDSVLPEDADDVTFSVTGLFGKEVVEYQGTRGATAALPPVPVLTGSSTEEAIDASSGETVDSASEVTP